MTSSNTLESGILVENANITSIMKMDNKTVKKGTIIYKITKEVLSNMKMQMEIKYRINRNNAINKSKVIKNFPITILSNPNT